ncbi:uncharacterized protein LOC116288812 [Actinia tenebrosa]|uniref:Uncharacterized protein LOC116288812 n=1 Tax=Actinia tenebrosa TaxID=6105 RepID=A0A6P8H569_ACTTE|nr:uncharacterized protein LOC116288812 [Actinia tenebrosa]
MASSADEAAALKRNVVHQTRLKLALRQLDRDKSLRIREINKDAQVFLHRLGESKKKAGLPDLKTASQTRAASAPVRQKDRQRITVNSKEQERRIATSTRPQDSNHPFVTKPSYQLANSDQRLGRFSSGRSLSTSSLCPPIKRNETPLRDHETQTPRDSAITPTLNRTRKEVRFSLPLDYADEEDKLETPRTPSPIVSKGIGLMRIKNTAQDRPSRRYSASHVRSKYL